MLESLRIAKYTFVLRMLEPAALPKFKGAMLRGTLGYSLRRVCWLNGSDPVECRKCVLQAVCPYGYVFETSLRKRPDAAVSDMPRPYVIDPPLDGRTNYAPGDRLSFDLVLVGRGIEYLPYFFAAYNEAGQVGLGKEWGRYELEQVQMVHPVTQEKVTIFTDGGWVSTKHSWAVAFPQLCEVAGHLPSKHVTVKFITPTRLRLTARTERLTDKVHGLAAEPAFPILLDNLLTRIALLLRVHCGEVWRDSREDLHAAAAHVQSECKTHWAEWTRTSTRQGKDLEYGGILGDAEYTGDMRPFLPFLLLGSLIHVGQKSDAGNGWYRIG